MVISPSPWGMTTWTEITFATSQTVLWVMPVRPGALLDWSSHAWMTAFEEATTLRVLPPSLAASCSVPEGPERASAWGLRGAASGVGELDVHETIEDLRAHAAARGLTIGPTVLARLTSLYTNGYRTVSFELAPTSAIASTSPVLRVSDDQNPVAPFALTGATETAVRLTAFVAGERPATIGTTRTLDASALTWGAAGNDYAAYRGALLATFGGEWLRESASAEALFDGASGEGGIGLPSIVETYFADAACTGAARAAASRDVKLGRVCAAGRLAAISGGAACTVDPSTADVTALTCGALDDLPLFASGRAPRAMIVSRLASLVLAGGLGVDAPIGYDTAATPSSPVVRASQFVCAPELPPVSSPPAAQPADDLLPTEVHGHVTVDGCGGSSVVTESDSDDSRGDGTGWDADDASTTSEACDGDSSDGEDAWDADDGAGSDACGSGGDDGWDDEDCSASDPSSDDGWDTTSAAPRPKSVAPRRTKSPVSRLALLFVAFVLPLRRRGRFLASLSRPLHALTREAGRSPRPNR